MIVLKKLVPLSRVQIGWYKFDNSYLKYLLRFKTMRTNCRVQYFSTAFSPSHLKFSMGKQVLYNCCDFVKPYISQSNIRLYSDDSDSTSRTKKILDDEDFKNILKDFAKDFDVNEEEASAISKDTEENSANPNDKKSESNANLSATDSDTLEIYRSIQKKQFKEFEDEDSTIIYSYEEEQKLDDKDTFFHIDQEYDSHPKIQELKRGITGVYDVEELISILREEKLFHICVIQIPKHCCYADYMVLATAKSLRHAKAVTEFVLKFHKMKKAKSDPFIKIEGEKLGNWKVMDMGNIVLHVFLEDVRTFYDIESLWLLDKEYDTSGKIEKDIVMDIMQEELDFMNSLNIEAETIANQEDSK